MALNVAERSERKRRRQKKLARLGSALVEAGRLGAWDEGDKEAIKQASDDLLADWADLVEARAAEGDTSGGVDPVPRRKVGGESVDDEDNDAREDADADS